jgi:leader peptidase (prepilin peptidase)/N-methyltransferase
MNGWLIALDVYLGLASIALTYFDVRFHRLPNLLTLGSYPVVAGLLLGAAASVPAGFENLGRAGLAALAMLATFVILHLVNKTGMGLGDVKLAPVIGAALGWSSWNTLLSGVFYAFIAAGVVASYLLMTKRMSAKDEIAFGPYLLLGMWLAMLQIG